MLTKRTFIAEVSVFCYWLDKEKFVWSLTEKSKRKRGAEKELGTSLDTEEEEGKGEREREGKRD